MAKTRQRTAAARSSKKDADEDVHVQDEEEQEKEIRELRILNRNSNIQSRYTLDVGVFMVMAFSLANLLRSVDSRDRLLIFICALQGSLLLLSLTPGWVPMLTPLSNYGYRYHTILVIVQLGLFAFVFNHISRTRPWTFLDIIRWALPEIMAGAVEIQRRGEREADEKLRALEAAKYPAKGA